MGSGRLLDKFGQPLFDQPALGSLPSVPLAGGLGSDVRVADSIQAFVEGNAEAARQLESMGEDAGLGMERSARFFAEFTGSIEGLGDAVREQTRLISESIAKVREEAASLRGEAPSDPGRTGGETDAEMRERLREEERVREEAREEFRRQNRRGTGGPPADSDYDGDGVPASRERRGPAPEPFPTEQPRRRDSRYQQRVQRGGRYSFDDFRRDIGDRLGDRFSGPSTVGDEQADGSFAVRNARNLYDLGLLTGEESGYDALAGQSFSSLIQTARERGVNPEGHTQDSLIGAIMDAGDTRLGAARGAAVNRKLMTRGILRQAGQNIGEGQGVFRSVTGALGSGGSKLAMLGRGLGAAGVAVGVLDQAATFVEGQRAENAEMMRLTGGDNAEAFEERMRRFGFGLSNRFGMGSQQAGILYENAARQFGSDRDSRDVYQRVGQNMFREFGLNAQQSSRLLNIASQEGSGAMLALRQSLRGVTAAARDAGVSVEGARERFATVYQTLSGQTQGTAGVRLAEQITTTEASLGRQLSNVDFTGAFSDQQMLLAGARRGMSQVEALGSLNDIDGNFGAEVVDENLAFAASRTSAASRQAIAGALAPLVNEDGEIDQAELDRATMDLMQQGAFNDSDVRNFQALYASRFGQQLSFDEAARLMVREVGGAVNPISDAERVREDAELRALTDEDREGIDADIRAEGRSFGEGSLGTAFTMASLGPAGAAGAFLPGGLGFLGGGRASAFDRSTSEDYEFEEYGSGVAGLWNDQHSNIVNSERAYRAFQSDTGMAHSGIESLMEMEEDFRDLRVRIETPEGARVVPLWQAIRSAPDQVVRGTATVVSGEHAGRRLDEIEGLATDPGATFAELGLDGASAENAALNNIGEDANQWAEDNPDAGGGGGTVRIEPSPELRPYFNFNGLGNVQIANSPPAPYGNNAFAEASRQ